MIRTTQGCCLEGFDFWVRKPSKQHPVGGPRMRFLKDFKVIFISSCFSSQPVKDLDNGFCEEACNDCVFADTSVVPTGQERFPEGRLLCTSDDINTGSCRNFTSFLEFKSSSDYLLCRGCLWIVFGSFWHPWDFCYHNTSQTTLHELVVFLVKSK